MTEKYGIETYARKKNHIQQKYRVQELKDDSLNNIEWRDILVFESLLYYYLIIMMKQNEKKKMIKTQVKRWIDW